LERHDDDNNNTATRTKQDVPAILFAMEKELVIDVELARPPTSQSLEHKTRRVSLHVPPEPPAKDPPRPMTASTKRLSASTFASSRRTLKYATKGRHAGLELVPQPSEDPEDPLVCVPLREGDKSSRMRANAFCRTGRGGGRR
jgi:hypothetical protein